ncbi:hypothetical protein KP509_36G032300 [Ceratopteris richardii]|uniref:NAC domain-containing protein n=1 Tax=Ceratopteris richardii TaxID=49495 RepID=A0A8T2QCD9_CERRI|nr:hypothetical protein KP509_36G032300 [Ceratopteris richardii]
MASFRMPPGFRFHPTDEELLVHYLKKKVAGKIEDSGIIGEVDIYKFEPSDLPELAILNSRDAEWFFFNAQDKKYLHRSRVNRTTESGYWKATGKDRRISVGSCHGLKKTLIYYLGRAPHGERTDWIMHEYRLDDEVEKIMNSPKSFVLCRIRRKSGVGPRNGEEYGAPVLEEEEEEIELKSPQIASLSPSACAESILDSQVQDMSNMASIVAEDVGRQAEEEFGSFLQSFLAVDGKRLDQEQDVVHDLLKVLDGQGDIMFAEPADIAVPTLPDTNVSSTDDFSGVFHEPVNGSLIVEDMLQLFNGQFEVQPEQASTIQDCPHLSSSLHSDDEQCGGFLEIADLDESLHEPSSLELMHYERLLSELSSVIETSASSSSGQDMLQSQEALQNRGWPHLDGSDMVNELEVSLDSFEGRLQDLEHYARDANANSPSISLSPQVHSEVGDDGPLCKSSLVHVLPSDNSSSTSHPPASTSPYSFVRVISLLLGKASALPASAAELPVDLKRLQEWKPRSEAYTNLVAPAICGPVGSKEKCDAPKERMGSTNVRELWSRQSIFTLNVGPERPSRSCTDGFSIFLFWIATSALILLYTFRGFCRSTRVAIL